MTSSNAKKPKSAKAKSLPPRRADLHSQYGRIGISAVAAALHYHGEARNPAHRPATPKADDRFAESEG